MLKSFYLFLSLHPFFLFRLSTLLCEMYLGVNLCALEDPLEIILLFYVHFFVVSSDLGIC